MSERSRVIQHEVRLERHDRELAALRAEIAALKSAEPVEEPVKRGFANLWGLLS